MTREDFRRILEQIKPFTDYVYFHVKGEPLLHPELGAFLELCAEYGLKVNLTTNGTLISEAADQLLLKSSLRQINFSLHSYDGNDAGEHLTDYLDCIFSFIKQSSDASDTLFSLRLWNLSRHDSATGSARRNRDVLRQIESAFKLPYLIDEQIDQVRGIKLAEKVFLSQDAEFAWPSLETRLHTEEDFSVGFCYGLKSQIAILVDGTVVPCCLDSEGIINLGNIHATPFSEIIQSPRAEKIHQGFSKKEVVEELCRKCTYRHRFNKSPKALM